MLQRILAPGYCRGHPAWTPAADGDAPRTRDEGGGEDAGWLRRLQLRLVCIGMYSKREWETTDDAIRKFRAAAMASSQGRYSRPGKKESGHAGGTAEGQGARGFLCRCCRTAGGIMRGAPRACFADDEDMRSGRPA
jgi:hypothetical protein